MRVCTAIRVSKMRNTTNAKMPNLGTATWRTILNIKLLCFPRCVPKLLLSHLPKFIEFFLMHSNVTIKNVSWLHFIWATLYILKICNFETISK